MKRPRTKQAILGLIGLVYTALIYPLCSDLWHTKWLLQMNNNECDPMFLSFFVVLGIFLLLAVKKPSEHRSLIAFAGWWSIGHAFVMAIQTIEARNHGVHREYTDVVIAAILGGVTLAVIPARRQATAVQESAVPNPTA